MLTTVNTGVFKLLEVSQDEGQRSSGIQVKLTSMVACTAAAVVAAVAVAVAAVVVAAAAAAMAAREMS
jgi:hypothetical protein